MIKKYKWLFLSFFVSLFNTKKTHDFRPRSILVMRYGFLGDVLQTTPLLSLLRKTWPEARIDYWVSRAAAPALSYNPNLSEIIDADFLGYLNIKKPLLILRYALFLKKRNYDLAVCLGPDPFYGLLAWLSGIVYRVGLIVNKDKAVFLHKWIEARLDDRTSRQKQYLELLKQLNIEVHAGEEKIQLFWTEDDEKEVNGLLNNGQNNYIALFCGTGPERFRPWANRQWSTKCWTELAKKIIQSYHDLNILLIGAEREKKASWSILSELPGERVINLVGKTRFSQLGPVLKKCRMLVSNDSSPVFLAAAVDCPAVVIYGPEWPERATPLGVQGWFPVHAEAGCRDNCASFPKHAPICKNECMSSITVEMVFNKVESAMRNEGAVRAI